MPVRARSRRRIREPATIRRAYDLVLSGRAWVRGKVQPLEVGIDEEGVIRGLGRTLTGVRRHDVGERILIPSATDLHVHFRDPVSAASGESWESGTLQAALGGVGLVGEMPNTNPPVSTPDRLQDRQDAGRGRLAIDMAQYAAVEPGVDVPAVAKLAAAFKIYLSPTTGSTGVEGWQSVEREIVAIAESGLALSVHAEDPTKFRSPEDATNPEQWSASRPVEAERSAVEETRLAPESLRLHIAHVTAPETVLELQGRGLSFEATPQHLLLSTHASDSAFFKVNPPLRPEPIRRSLWDAFREGRIPILASDHAPHPLEAKLLPFRSAPSGMPGVETAIPVLLNQVRSSELELPVLLAAACDRPARWLGVPQGRIAVGHRANLLVVDFRLRTRIVARALHAPCGWSSFEGMEAIFPQEHFLDGERIVQDGEYVGQPTGRFLRPEYAPGSIPLSTGPSR